jgi:hypothetical protein
MRCPPTERLACPLSPAYQPLLVLLLAELTVADTTVTPSDQVVVSEAGSGTPAGTTPVVARLAVELARVREPGGKSTMIDRL